MSTFAVRVTLMHPEHREQTIEADLLVDTGSTYSLLPPDLVERLRLPIFRQTRAMLASGEHATYRLGEVRMRIGDDERTTVFFAGAPSAKPLLGAVTLEEFGLGVDPSNQRLIEGPLPLA